MLRLEAGPEKTDTVVDMAGEAVADLEAHEADTVVVAVDLWALLLHLETGDVVRDLVLTVAVVEVASEVEGVVTSGSAVRSFHDGRPPGCASELRQGRL
jgi:hypothetical protein